MPQTEGMRSACSTEDTTLLYMDVGGCVQRQEGKAAERQHIPRQLSSQDPTLTYVRLDSSA